MEKLLNEIKSIPGVTGSYVFSRKHGIMAKQMPDIFKAERLEKMGTQLNRSFTIGKKSKTGIESLEIGFESIKILGYGIDESTCFYVFCQPNSNMALIKMSLDVICMDILEAVQNYSASLVKQEAAAPAEKTPAEKVSPKILMASSALGKELGSLKHAFTLAMGPMAEIIMMKVMKKWIAAGNADKSGLNKLVDLLQEQIDDPNTITEFKENTKSIL